MIGKSTLVAALVFGKIWAFLTNFNFRLPCFYHLVLNAVVMAEETMKADPPAPVVEKTPLHYRQYFLWTSILLIVSLIATLCVVAGMDLNKEQDTILYAKFLTKVEDKMRWSSIADRNPLNL